jgi:hypothetical protein
MTVTGISLHPLLFNQPIKSRADGPVAGLQPTHEEYELASIFALEFSQNGQAIA